ncbi:MAG: shikimate kinase [Actinobacteria bacterium]|uniref:shikimate kinase n=1 Tax=freshwater metagenome TaxID=449393 RepID=A0A6J6SKK2_9ZZZZ|nr:shikimate kinase [Actinomycetota bacterium]
MPKAVLIGPPGAGKSSVGRQLAKLWDCEIFDSDSEIEKVSGKKIADIFTEDGEPAFRAIEREVVLSALKSEPGVIALGGGSVLDETVADYLRSSSIPVLYLEVSISQAAPRVGFNKERPLLAMNPRQQWMALMEKRRAIYEGLATQSFNTDNRKPAEVASEIAQTLGVKK